MPLAIYWADRILQNLAQARHSGEIIGIEPDAKSQVTLEYDEDGTPKGIKTIVLSTQHNENLSQEEVRRIACRYIEQTLPAGWMPADKDILINPTGRFVIGGPDGDTGLTGRKIIVDTYGGYAPHGGGAFSGKDPTKVDRSAAYMLRYLAKTLSLPDWPTNACCKFLMPLVWLNLCPFTSAPTKQTKPMKAKSSLLSETISS